MTDFRDELSDIPEDVEKIFSGSINIGGKKIPKAVLIGGAVIVGAVVFVVSKNKGSGGGSESSNPAANIPNAFTPDSGGSGSGQGGSSGSGNGIPTSGDLISSIPLPSIPLPDFSGVGMPDYTQAPPIPYMSTGGGGYGDYSPAMNPYGNTGIAGVETIPNSAYDAYKDSAVIGHNAPVTSGKKSTVQRGVVSNTKVTKKASANNPLSTKSVQTFANTVKPAVNSLKPVSNVVNIIGGFLNNFTGGGYKPRLTVPPKTSNFVPAKPATINTYKPVASVNTYKAPVSVYKPYVTPNYIPYSTPKYIPPAPKPLPKTSYTAPKSRTTASKY